MPVYSHADGPVACGGLGTAPATLELRNPIPVKPLVHHLAALACHRSAASVAHLLCRCVAMLADLFHAPGMSSDSTGTHMLTLVCCWRIPRHCT